MCCTEPVWEFHTFRMALGLFGSHHVLHWHGTELVWEPSRVALAWQPWGVDYRPFWLQDG